MDFKPSLFGICVLAFIYILLFIMYCHYHLKTFKAHFCTSDQIRGFSVRHRKLLFRKATPYRCRKTSESCPGGLSSFQTNIRKLGPLRPVPSMPTIKTDDEEIEEEPLKTNIEIN